MNVSYTLTCRHNVTKDSFRALYVTKHVYSTDVEMLIIIHKIYKRTCELVQVKIFFWKNAEKIYSKTKEDYCDIKSKHKFNLKKKEVSFCIKKNFWIQNQKKVGKKGYKPRINSIEKSLPFMYIRSKHTNTVWTSGAMIFDKDATRMVWGCHT